MEIPFYLAQTGAEFRRCESLPEKIGWMACHFSPYGTGLSNLPSHLPENSLLILNDRTPVRGHDPQRIFQQLSELILQHRCSGLLLDFQDSGNAEAASVAAALAALPCPVAISAAYAQDLPCAVFAPPVPLLTPVADHLKPWSGRPIWLEVALDRTVIAVTPEGSRYIASAYDANEDHPLCDEALCCHYRIDRSSEQAVFTLQRTWDDLQMLLQNAQAHGAVCAVGLYQEFNDRFPGQISSPAPGRSV